MALGWYPSVWEEVQSLETELRARCKGHLDRLQRIRPGEASGLRLEKVHKQITELKVSWNKQEFRFLFFTHDGQCCVLSFFQKKTRKTPPSEVDKAIVRMREIELGTATAASGTLN